MLLFKQLIPLKMIKENDLRLNNLVMVNYKTDLLSKVTWIQEGSINVIFDRQPDLVNGIACSVNDLIPIPVTEKILLSCGFKKRKSCFGYWIYEIMFHHTVFSVEDVDFGLCYFYIGNTHVTQTRYVHELQNLYFSITGEELVFSTEPL